MPKNEKSLATIIKEARENIGISQRELARQIGVGNNTIARLENGERKTTNALTLRKISSALHLDYLELLKMAGFSEQDISFAMQDNSNIVMTSKDDKVYSIDEMIELDKQMLAKAEEHISILKDTLDNRDNPNYKNLDPDNVKFMDQQDEELLNFYLQIKSIYLNRIKHFEDMKKGE